MSHRGGESPMDFQYDAPTGPTDPNSPFTRFSSMGNSLHETPAKKSELLFYSLPFAALKLTSPTWPSRPGSLAAFQSSTPSKLPMLTPPASQHFPFPKTAYQTPRPPPPQFRPLPSTTPRSAALDMSEFSKDPDIFSSPVRAPVGNPGPQSDSETTPEASHTPRRGSKLIVFGSTTPVRITGRGEVPRGRYHDGAITKLRPRRHQRWPSARVITDDEDSGSEFGETDYAPPPTWGSSGTPWASTHRDIPLIASQYLQIFFNLSLILLLLYALFCFYLTIRRDVDQKVEEFSAQILAEISQCSRNYVENRCTLDMRVPAMERACSGWEKCMNRDSSQVGRARVSAETFAEIINSFIEPISYKTMFFCLISVFGGLFFSNFAFGFYRAKALNHPAPYLTAAAPPIASLLEQQQNHDHHGRPSTPVHTPRPSTSVRGTPARAMGYQSVSRTPGDRRAIEW